MAQSLGLCIDPQSEDTVQEELFPRWCGKGSVTSPDLLTAVGNDNMVLP